MSKIEYRQITRTEINKLSQIDRTEIINDVYYVRDGALVLEKEHHDEFVNGPSQLIKELNKDEWEIFNFFNNGIFKTKPASTGLTILQRCKN